MKQRKIPMRMCIVTRESCPKSELIRIVKTEDGVIIDPSGKVNGHGAYLKKDLEVFEKAEKSKVLNKVLDTEVSHEVFEELKKII